MPEKYPLTVQVTPEDAGQRLDQFLAAKVPMVSRGRLQRLIREQKVLVNEATAKSALRLRGNEQIRLLAPAEPPPLRAMPEDLPLDVVYEDDDLAVINKPAGMMVHAGAGAVEHARNRGTLVNALLHRFGKLSGVGGGLRPGIVHRLDKATSGLMVIAKNDEAHRLLASQFSGRQINKSYVALVHGWLKQDQGTVQSGISRDRVRRTRMTTRRAGGREAISHYQVLRRLQTGFGKFTLLQVKIATGRTHQIRVQMASLGHPVVGDRLYGAARELRAGSERMSLERNFLHSAGLEFCHPRTAQLLAFSVPLPAELEKVLDRLESN